MSLNVLGGSLEFDAVVRLDNYDLAIRRIEAQLQGLTRTAEKESSAIENLVKRTTQAIGAYASFTAAGNFVKDIVRVRGEFQQLEVAFTTMLGSKIKADKLLREVAEFAATTPFELKDVAGAAKQLLAFGISAEKIKPTLRSLGDISAGIGAPLGEIAYLFGTIKTQGVAMTMDVRQFAQRGIPIYEALAEVLGVATTEVGDFITAGKVGFPEIEKAFQNLTKEGSKFGGLMAEQSKTLVGQLSNLSDAWNGMLNEIGKSGQNIFSDAISAAAYVVENYQKVIDILQVIAFTYGAYKAAVLATTAANIVAMDVQNGLTVAQSLHNRAILIGNNAMKLFNSTLLKNPFALVVASVTALITALALFRNEADQARSKADILAEAQGKIGNSFTEQEAKIRPYVDQLKNAKLSQEQLIGIYEKLRAINPAITKDLDAKKISYQNLSAAVNGYLNDLRKQYALEANKEAVLISIGEENKVQEQRKNARKKLNQDIEKLDASRERTLNSRVLNETQKQSKLKDLDLARAELARKLNEQDKELYALLLKQRGVTEEIGQELVTPEVDEPAAKKTIKYYNDLIAAQQKIQQEEAVGNPAYEAAQKKILEYKKEIRKITGETTQETKAAQVVENKALAMLEKRKDLLDEIAEQQRNADQSGMLKEQSEIDKVNERYDQLIKKVGEYNSKVDDFNDKNGTNVQKIGALEMQRIEAARKQELANTGYKEDAEKFKKSLDDKREIFEAYQNAIKDLGIAKAKEMYRAQTGDYESFLKLLQAEAIKLLPKVTAGIANVGELEKYKAILAQIAAYKKKKQADDLNEDQKNFQAAMDATINFNDKKINIEEKYSKLRKAIEKDTTLPDKEARLKALTEAENDEIEAEKDAAARKTGIMKLLGQDLIRQSRQDLKARLKVLKDTLKNDSSLTPELFTAVNDEIERLNELLRRTGKTTLELIETMEWLDVASDTFGKLGDAVRGLNGDIADTLDQMSASAKIGSDSLNATLSFMSGDYLSAATSTANAIAGIVTMISKAAESARKAQQEVLDFQTKVIAGEAEYDRIIRERQRNEADANKSKLQGLRDQNKLLEEQRKLNEKIFNDLLAQIQEEQYISGQKAKKKKGSLLGGLVGVFAGGQTEVQSILSSLADKSYDDLEKLYTSGQLTDKAKALFEQLQKIKQEGFDIDAMLEENKIAAQELFTGTTSDSIVDSIADGFKNGLRSASDFADNFQELMRNAIIQSLKLKYLEGPLDQFYKDFAAAAESDDTLTSAEVEQLNTLFNSIIGTAQQQFDQLQQISGLNLQSQDQANSLQGAIKGMTADQATLLAGQFGGLRITNLEIQRLATEQLASLNQIQINTSLTVVRMSSLLSKFDSYENGSTYLNVKVK